MSETCPTCGCPVKVAGKTTLHLEPILQEKIKSLEEVLAAAKKLTGHLDIILEGVTLSGTFHLKERLKKAIENLKAQE